MTFNKNIFSLCMSRRFISRRVLFVPVSLLFAVSSVNLQSCPASTVSTIFKIYLLYKSVVERDLVYHFCTLNFIPKNIDNEMVEESSDIAAI